MKLSGFRAAHLVQSILDADPGRKQAVADIRNLLVAICPRRKYAVVDHVLHRFVLYVMDLAASEKNHHARPYGLIDHSLEVVKLSLEDAQALGWPPSWVYGVFVAALLHDIGKTTDVAVRAPEGAVWNPFVEPLAAFYVRYRLAPGDLAQIHYRAGRGLDGHVRIAPYFYSAILPVEAREYLGQVLSALLLRQSPMLEDLVHRVDGVSASRDRARKPPSRGPVV